MAYRIPDSIDAVLVAFDQGASPIDLHDVSSALQKARGELQDPCDEENKGAWADVLAMALTPWPHQPSPWQTFFGPVMSGETADGTAVHRPDISGADADTIAQWKSRAETLQEPTLKARYADLVWDMSPAMTESRRREAAFAAMAIDAYITSAGLADQELLTAFAQTRRALSLAIQIKDAGRVAAARAAILALHGKALAANQLWWESYDILVEQRNSGLTTDERDALVADLETALVRYADEADPAIFNPHFVQRTAERLLKHYRREKLGAEEKRIHQIVARATEHHASLGDAMLASSVLNDSMEAYKKAGLVEEAERVRRLMAEKVREANGQMATIRQEVRISFEEVEAFQAAIVSDDPFETLARIAKEFLLRRSAIEEQVAAQEKAAPLMAMIPQMIMGEDHVVATVGSTDEDPYGRLLRHALFTVSLNSTWLGWAMEATMDRHRLHAGHLTAWANRAGLFGDGALLADGLHAWLEGDNVKAMHVLIPQIEHGLRALIGAAGRPTSKPHPKFKGAQVAVTMGDAIYSKETIAALGPRGEDLALHLATLYADPRGSNLRNELAHGLLGLDDIHDGVLLWIVHTLLLLGLWRAPPKPEVASAPGDSRDALG